MYMFWLNICMILRNISDQSENLFAHQNKEYMVQIYIGSQYSGTDSTFNITYI